MIHKATIKKGSRVLVKTRHPGSERVTIREGRVIDAHRDCLKVEYRLWVFRWSEWLPVKDDFRTLEYISANASRQESLADSNQPKTN